MMLKMKLPGGSKRGRRHKRFMDIVKEGMQKAGVTEEEDAGIE